MICPSPILNNAVSTAISSSDYSYKSANKNPITSRSDSGSDCTWFSLQNSYFMEVYNDSQIIVSLSVGSLFK